MKRRIITISTYHWHRRLRHPPGSSRGPLLLALALGLLALLVAGIGASGAAAYGVYSYYAQGLPPPEVIAERQVALSTKVYDRNGGLLYEFFDPQWGPRTWVPLSEIPMVLQLATIATEDADFYRNQGINFRGLLRALVENVRAGEILQGGSSITQQLVKNVLIPEEERTAQTVSRKARELILAYEATRIYPKEKILEMYLNEIFYGNLSYGVAAAAQNYFGKSVGDLDLAESAMIAGLPQAPGYYDPLTDLATAKARQEEVLGMMVRQNFITEEQAEEAQQEKLRFSRQGFALKAPHFVMYVQDLLIARYGSEAVRKGGLTVHTSLDLGMQEEAERVARAHVERLRPNNAHDAALVAIRPQTGEILTLLGSADYFDASIDGQVNVALAERQPGSSIKPITYLAAFMKGYNPATMLLDVLTEFPDGANKPYVPKNVDFRFRGPVLVRQALATSLNIPAVKALQYVGIREMVDMARRLGITSLRPDRNYGLSVTLGGGEVKLIDLVYAYSVLANRGVMSGAPVPPDRRQPGERQLEPVAILKVIDAEGNVLEEFARAEQNPVVSPQLAYLMTSVLSDNNARAPLFGLNSPLKLSDRPAAVKTGSTDDYRDAWTVGYTPDLAVGVWVGNANNEPMQQALSTLTAAPIWHDFMEAVLKGKPARPFAEPDGLERVRVCAISGLLPSRYCTATVEEVFIKGTAPRRECDLHQVFRVDVDTGKLAGPDTPPEKVEEKVFLVLPPEGRDWARANNIPQPEEGNE